MAQYSGPHTSASPATRPGEMWTHGWGPPRGGALGTGRLWKPRPLPCPLSFPSSTPTTDWGPGCPLGRRIQPPRAVVAPEPGAGKSPVLSSLPPAGKRMAPGAAPRATGSLEGHCHVRSAGCVPGPSSASRSVPSFPDHEPPLFTSLALKSPCSPTILQRRS